MSYNSTIKQKFGNCLDCGKYGPVTSGRCGPCYKKHRAKVCKAKKDASPTGKEEKAFKNELSVYFANQTLVMPATCENCNSSLTSTKNFHPRAPIAHILPKRKNGGFPSVATHPQNKLFLCLDCHTKFDNDGKDKVKQMPVFQLAIERLKEFVHLITEKRELPNDFRDYL